MQFASILTRLRQRRLTMVNKIGEQAYKPDSVPRQVGVAIIPLGRGIASGL